MHVSPADTDISSATPATISSTGSAMSSKMNTCLSARTASMNASSLRGRGGRRRLFLLPASAERTIQQDDRDQLVPPRARQPQLRVKELPLRVQHLEVAGHSSLVPERGEPGRDGDRLHLVVVRRARVSELLDAHRSVGDFLQGLLYRLPIGGDGLVEPRPRRLLGRGQAPALEDGSEDAPADA